MIEAIIFAWLLVYIFPVESLVTYFNVYMKLEVTVWVTYSNIYTKLEVIARGCLLEETKLDFLYSSWKQLNCFCFRLNIFAGNISIFLLPLVNSSQIRRWVNLLAWSVICRKNYYVKIHGPEAVIRRYSVKEVFLEISRNSQENTCARVSFLKKCRPEACNFFKKETLAQEFSSEFCEISKNSFFTEYLWATTFTSAIENSQILIFRRITFHFCLQQFAL